MASQSTWGGSNDCPRARDDGLPSLVTDLLAATNGANPNRRRKVITQHMAEIDKHNAALGYALTPLPPINTTDSEYKVFILGFDENTYPANVILDSGCVASGVIGQRLAKRANIVEYQQNASYMFVIESGGRHFIGYTTPNAETLTKRSSCYIKSSDHAPGYISCFDGVRIDLLIGHETMKQMSKCGFFSKPRDTAVPASLAALAAPAAPAAPPLIRPSTKRFIPASSLDGLKIELSTDTQKGGKREQSENKVYTHIDTGNFIPYELDLSKSWVSRNMDKLTECAESNHDFCTHYTGKISLRISYDEIDVEFADLTFVAHSDLRDLSGKIVTCVPGDLFLRRLAEHGIYLMC